MNDLTGDNEDGVAIEKYNIVELANAVTHGLGFLFGIVATIFMLQKTDSLQPNTIFGLSIFGFSLMFLYLASTLYHSIPFNKPKTKDLFRRIDQTAIYWLISGTNTPFYFFFLEGKMLWISLSIMWFMALCGSLYKLFYTDEREWVNLLLYGIMGASGYMTIPQMSEALTQSILNWVFLGGLFYTLGIIFYVWEKMRWHHVIWHLFVLAGSAAHFWAVWLSF